MMRVVGILTMMMAMTGVASADGLPSRSFEFTYKVAVESIPAEATSVKVWVPVPQSNESQAIENIRVTGASDHRFVREELFGNKFLLVDVKPGNGHASFELAFDATRKRVRALEVSDRAAEAPENPELYLSPTRMMKIDGPVAEEAQRVAGTAGDPLVQARALYDHIVDTVEYDKSGEGWGRGDTTYACDARRGNCTDFHSLFMGEAISLGIPSRFTMGFSVPSDAPAGSIGGYHCWAEFYIAGRGWIPVDASEARKNAARRDELFGGLDEHRVQFTMGRDLMLPGMQGEPVNFSIYPYAEVDGQPHAALKTQFSYRDLN